MEGHSLLTSLEDVQFAIEHDDRLGSWHVRRQGEGWLELETVGILDRARAPLMVVLAWPELWRDEERIAPHLARARSGNYALMVVGDDHEFVEGRVSRLAQDGDVAALAVPASADRLALALSSRAESAAWRQVAAHLEMELAQAQYEINLLIDTGRALSQERRIGSLLELILSRTRDVTGADAGSVYIVEGEGEARQLRFMVSQNDSRQIDSRGFTMPVSDSSIVGSCVLTGSVIDIPDLYFDWRQRDRSFDERYSYQTRSMLTVPMISARGDVIGVIQLINKRARGIIRLDEPGDFTQNVVPFDAPSIAYAASLASQAGIALENALLYDEVRTLFDGFVRASVTAIESRDPTTSGHSERVAQLTTGLAQAIDRIDTGPYRDTHFEPDDLKQIEYAALLHDFGKVGVREHVLVKAKKLYEHQRDHILQRFQLIRRGVEVDTLTTKVRCLEHGELHRLQEIDAGALTSLAELDEMMRWILSANEPTVLEQGGFDRIADIAGRIFTDPDGHVRPYLTQDEATALQIMRGSLTREERFEIESHVVHTYNFLRQIPWGRQFRDVPDIAGAHHEKLDGTGYPNQLKAEAIPVPAKMMTISDIYDALTAKDRPYKKAMPVEKALDILSFDVKKGLLDTELFRVFVEAKIWEAVSK